MEEPFDGVSHNDVPEMWSRQMRLKIKSKSVHENKSFIVG